MTVYTLFNQAYTASLASDPTGYTMAVQFDVTVPGATLTAIWFYSAPGAAALPQDILLFTVSGTTNIFQQAASWSGAAGSGWVRAPATSPPVLTASAAYKGCVSQDTAVNWYSATPHDWDTGAHGSGVTSGPLSAPNDAGANPGQGSFIASANLYPNQSFNATNYGVDVEITIPDATLRLSRPVRPRLILPYRKARAHGSPGVAGSTAAVPGQPGSITVQALTGGVLIPVSIRGPAGIITVAPVTGSVTAVTGSPGRTIRSRRIMPPRISRGHGQAGTSGARIPGATGTITIRGIPGNVQAVTGSPGKVTRSRIIIPPHRGTGRGLHGTAGTVVTGHAAQVSTTAFPGGISIAISGVAGTVAVHAGPGFMVVTPYRYARWDIDRGFARSEWRSHLVTGDPGSITVKAPAGTVTVQYFTMGTADSAGRQVSSRTRMPPRRGRPK